MVLHKGFRSDLWGFLSPKHIKCQSCYVDFLWIGIFLNKLNCKQRWRLMKSYFPSDSRGTVCSPAIHGVLENQKIWLAKQLKSRTLIFFFPGLSNLCKKWEFRFFSMKWARRFIFWTVMFYLSFSLDWGVLKQRHSVSRVAQGARPPLLEYSSESE